MLGVAERSDHHEPVPASQEAKAALGESGAPLPERGGASVVCHASSPASQCTRHDETHPPCCGADAKPEAASAASKSAAYAMAAAREEGFIFAQPTVASGRFSSQPFS